MRLIFVLSGIVNIALAATTRPADQSMHSGTCRTLPIQHGKNVCAFCDWQSTPLNCNNDSKTGRWNMCADKAIPNPCATNEVLYLSSRNSIDGFEDPLCADVCPGKRCFTNTMTYKDTCCTCPQGWRPKARAPFCVNGNDIGTGQFCVGCKEAGEQLVWSESRKAWDCVKG